jgi:DNA repair exonuclease SbcCD nuclease subunit
MFSFLHAADLQLGLRITRFDAKTAKDVREARFLPVDTILNVARRHPLRFILIAGDLFDDYAVDNPPH